MGADGLNSMTKSKINLSQFYKYRAMLVAKCIALIQNGGDDDDGNRLRRRWLTTFKPTKKHKHTRRQHTLMPEQRSHTCNRMCTPDLNSYDFNCVVILRCFEIYQRRVRCSTTRIRARVAYSPIFNNLVICVLIAAQIDWFFCIVLFHSHLCSWRSLSLSGVRCSFWRAVKPENLCVCMVRVWLCVGVHGYHTACHVQ